jgi:hypothetical protein
MMLATQDILANRLLDKTGEALTFLQDAFGSLAQFWLDPY